MSDFYIDLKDAYSSVLDLYKKWGGFKFNLKPNTDKLAELIELNLEMSSEYYWLLSDMRLHVDCLGGSASSACSQYLVKLKKLTQKTSDFLDAAEKYRKEKLDE